MGEQRYAIFDRETGRQVGRSFSDRKEALRVAGRLGDRGKGSAPEVVRHDQERKREKLR